MPIAPSPDFWRSQASSPVSNPGPDWKFWDFPLEVKKRWRFSPVVVIDLGVYQIEIWVTVEALEDVQTTAGTFRAFRIRREWSVYEMAYVGKLPYRFSETLWFAPAAKWIVKYTSNEPKRPSWKLVRYRLR